MRDESLNVKSSLSLLAAGAALLAFLAPPSFAAEAEPALSATALAAQLSAKQQDGTALIRVKMVNMGAEKTVLQLQIKQRSSRAGTDLLYQVLFPRERKGEAVLLRKSGRGLSGTQFTPSDGSKPIFAAQMDEPLLGSALSYEDVATDPYSWDKQALVGTETVDKVECQILESKPSGESAYSSVKSWVDTRRLLPLRIEKYTGGKLVRKIETTHVANDDKGRPVPANLLINGPRGAVTEMEGSRIRHGVSLSDATFTAEGAKDLSAPKGAE